MTFEELQAIGVHLRYRNWVFRIERDDQGTFLQVQFYKGGLQGCRKWRLSQHMTKSEVVQTAFKAVATAEEHETREAFMYRGRPVFGPHLDVDALVELCDAKRTDMRVPV